MSAARTVTALAAEPPEQVWACLADFAGLSRWASRVSHSAPLTEPARGTGAERRVQIGREALRERVLLWDEPRRLVYTVEGLPAVVRRVVTTWELTAEGDGTRIRLTSDVTTRPPLAARLVARRVARENQHLADDLSTRAHTAEATP